MIRWILSHYKYVLTALVSAGIPSYFLIKEKNKPAEKIVETVVVKEEVKTVEYVEKEVIKWKTRDRVIVKTETKPDGTKIETQIRDNVKSEVKEEVNNVSETKSVEKRNSQISLVSKDTTRFGLGILANPFDSSLTHTRLAFMPLASYNLFGQMDLLASIHVDIIPSFHIRSFNLGLMWRF